MADQASDPVVRAIGNTRRAIESQKRYLNDKPAGEGVDNSQAEREERYLKRLERDAESLKDPKITSLMGVILDDSAHHTHIDRLLDRDPDAKKDMNVQDSKGMTALMHAVQHPDLGYIAERLVDEGADVTVKNKDGKTAADLWKAVRDDVFHYDNKVGQSLADKLEPKKGGRKSRRRKTQRKKTYRRRRFY